MKTKTKGKIYKKQQTKKNPQKMNSISISTLSSSNFLFAFQLHIEHRYYEYNSIVFVTSLQDGKKGRMQSNFGFSFFFFLLLFSL